MILLVSNHRELFEAAESYFKQAKRRCVNHDGRSCYARDTDGERCVIGDVLQPETEYELFWLRSFKGTADALLAGMFDVHPFTRFAEVAVQLQILHDTEDNWITNVGFINWPEFFKLKETYA